MSWRIKALQDAVTLLASEATAQVEHLRQLGLADGIDELALAYDDVAAAADDMLRLGELDKHQYDSVKNLHSLLSRMSGKADLRLWTVEALSSSAEWKEVRSAAKACLRLLGGSQ